MAQNRIKLCGLFAGAVFAVCMTTGLAAQTTTMERLAPLQTGDVRLIEGKITGRDAVDYVIRAEQSQIVSVDMLTPHSSSYFNILLSGVDEALFIGSVSGNVADLHAPETGDYVIRVYLMASAARRKEIADYVLGVSIGAPEFADGLSGGPDYWAVSGIRDGGVLNLREGPSTRYDVIAKLSKNDVLQNRGCRMTGAQSWCQIRTTLTGNTGWVAGDYLSETSPPPVFEPLENGPVGNGTPFDATGLVPCAAAPDQPMRQCPMGVVRGGPGNAGIWITSDAQTERHILFEANAPVASDAAEAFRFDMQGDLFVVHVGEERYEIPDAVINGG